MTGTGSFIRLILRRDRVKLPVWIVSVVASLVAIAPLLRNVYGDMSELTMLHQVFGTNPAGLMLTGPMDAPTLGALMTVETLLWWAMAMVLMNVLFVVRHTRHNEEIGAQELLLSGRAHRAAGLNAVLLIAVVMNLIVAVGIGAGLDMIEQSWGSEHAWLYGLAMGLFGMVWAAATAVVVQLVESSRAAIGTMVACMGGAFLLRGTGDFLGTMNPRGVLEPAWYSWLSPFGWLQATRPLTFPEWWPLWISAGFVIVATVGAFLLLARRDVGAGLLPARKGRIRAGATLRTSLGLTWHLQRNVFLGWLVGVVAMVAMVGVLVPEMSGIYDSNDNLKQMIQAMGGDGAIVPSFLAAMLNMTSLLVMAYAVHALGRLRGEESSGRLEPLLATRLGRTKWLGENLLIVVAGSAFMMAVTGLLLAVFVNSNPEYAVTVSDYVGAGISYLPAVLVFVGAYVLLFGLIPRVAGLLVWLYFGLVAFMTWLGPMLKLDERIMDLSIVNHLGTPPVTDVAWTPLLIMLAAAAGGLVVGWLAWRRRDMQTG